MNRSIVTKFLIVVTILIFSKIYANEIWKISLYDGSSLSCEKLNGIENDSLHTTILGESQSFAVNDIKYITKFNKNINYRLVGGSVVGGLIGGLLNQVTNSNDRKNNQSGTVLIGAFAGATLSQYLSSRGSIRFSKMTKKDKNTVLEGLVLNSH